MIKVAMVKANGEVGYIISPAVDDDYVDGQGYGDYTARIIPHDSVDDEYIFEKYWSDGWQSKGSQPSDWHEWVDGSWVLNTGWLFSAIRNERTMLLALSDWAVIPDSPLSDSKKAEWTTYRQALRDVPANNSSVTRLEDVDWPTKPE